MFSVFGYPRFTSIMTTAYLHAAAYCASLVISNAARISFNVVTAVTLCETAKNRERDLLRRRSCIPNNASNRSLIKRKKNDLFINVTPRKWAYFGPYPLLYESVTFLAKSEIYCASGRA